MELSTLGISLTKISNSVNYIDLYDVLYSQKIIYVLIKANKSLVILLTNGKLVRYNPESMSSKLYMDSV